MRRPVSVIVIAVLAVTQGVLGILRAFKWFQIGAETSGQGILILPLMSALVYARGGIIVVIALLYVLFALGALTGKGWARRLGLVASLVNGLLVLSLVIGGESIVQSVFWLIVPAILIWYLLSPSGRQALKS